jgi:hypothetical protein
MVLIAFGGFVGLRVMAVGAIAHAMQKAPSSHTSRNHE